MDLRDKNKKNYIYVQRDRMKTHTYFTFFDLVKIKGGRADDSNNTALSRGCCM